MLLLTMSLLTHHATLAKGRSSKPSWVDPCPPPKIELRDWWRAKLQGFSMSLPPNYREVKIRGKDCYVGSYEASDSTGHLFFSLCGFSDPLTQTEGFARYTSCTETIGGKEARLISAKRGDGDWPPEFRYYIGGAWRDVRPNIHLTLWGEAKNLHQVEVLLAAVRTVRFEEATK
jgi:hypothetical protein